MNITFSVNITFFIGNGFDLNLGLKTRYKDFYKYFKENVRRSNIIRGWINEKDILWSDLEKALGQSLSSINRGNLEQFYDDKDEMDDLLIDYLQEEQEKYSYEDEENIKKELIASLDNFDINLSKADKQRIYRVKQRHAFNGVMYNFVVFNYTNCVDRIVEIQKKEDSVISTHTYFYDASQYNSDSKLGEIYHIHGTVNEEMILGVNDESQINNEFLKQEEIFCDSFIKSYMNKMIGQQKTEEVQDLINNSEIICLFGMSIGETDKLWWEKIVDWLVEDKEKLLVIFWRDNKKLNKNRLPSRTIRNNDKVKNQFLEKGKGQLTDEKLRLIKDRIFVSYNDDDDIFNFPKYDEEKDDSLKVFGKRFSGTRIDSIENSIYNG